MKAIGTLYRIFMSFGFGLIIAVTLGTTLSLSMGSQYAFTGIGIGFVIGIIGGWFRK